MTMKESRSNSAAIRGEVAFGKLYSMSRLPGKVFDLDYDLSCVPGGDHNQIKDKECLKGGVRMQSIIQSVDRSSIDHREDMFTRSIIIQDESIDDYLEDPKSTI